MTFLDSEVEYQLQRHRKEDNIVTLNVGGTRYEVGHWHRPYGHRFGQFSLQVGGK